MKINSHDPPRAPHLMAVIKDYNNRWRRENELNAIIDRGIKSILFFPIGLVRKEPDGVQTGLRIVFDPLVHLDRRSMMIFHRSMERLLGETYVSMSWQMRAGE
jgi:hypothetical protein